MAKRVKTEETAKEEIVAEKETIVSPTEVPESVKLVTDDVKEIDEEKIQVDAIKKKLDEQLAIWVPKTELGKKVKAGQITDIDEIFNSGKPILEVEIIDTLFPNLESDLLMVGQSKGKFGGGARRVFRQTQKKTNEGNKPSFATIAVVGNRNGYVGVGYGKSKETVPAREKALRKAKINLFRIKRGSGSWQSSTNEPHSIPYAVTGKCGSVEVTLLPAPVGRGLVIEKECRKILELAGIRDVWSKSFGKKNTKMNFIMACVDALKKLNDMKLTKKKEKELSIFLGSKKVD